MVEMERGPLSILSTQGSRLRDWSEHPYSYSTFLPKTCTVSPYDPLQHIYRRTLKVTITEAVLLLVLSPILVIFSRFNEIVVSHAIDSFSRFYVHKVVHEVMDTGIEALILVSWMNRNFKTQQLEGLQSVPVADIQRQVYRSNAGKWSVRDCDPPPTPTPCRFRERVGFYIFTTQEVATQGYASFQAVSTVRCHTCGEEGHIRPRCPRNPRAFKDPLTTTTPQYKVGFCMENRTVPCFTMAGTISGSWASTIIRYTGCSGIVVSEEVLPNIDPSLFPKVKVADYLGRVDEFPVVRCYLQCRLYTGWTDAVRPPIKFATAFVGNIPGVNDPREPNEEPPSDARGQAEQRSYRHSCCHYQQGYQDPAFRISRSLCC
ncbi:hypothetical protein O3P69_017974 [Scylla paramamosain]|uniref:CCHC-type domain-containing protein n=1 Tax=Scylla paramamosain TaxID=85552 RepID=A0AAW0TGZ7_SCYPA